MGVSRPERPLRTPPSGVVQGGVFGIGTMERPSRPFALIAASVRVEAPKHPCVGGGEGQILMLRHTAQFGKHKKKQSDHRMKRLKKKT